MALVILKVGLVAGWFFPPTGQTVAFETLAVGASGANGVTTLLSIFVMLNVLLGVFNLLPLPPLDGAAVASILLPPTARARVNEFMSNGAMSLLGLVVAWRVFPRFVDDLFLLVLRLLYV